MTTPGYENLSADDKVRFIESSTKWAIDPRKKKRSSAQSRKKDKIYKGR